MAGIIKGHRGDVNPEGTHEPQRFILMGQGVMEVSIHTCPVCGAAALPGVPGAAILPDL
jgi:hypothetical protein